MVSDNGGGRSGIKVTLVALREKFLGLSGIKQWILVIIFIQFLMDALICFTWIIMGGDDTLRFILVFAFFATIFLQNNFAYKSLIRNNPYELKTFLLLSTLNAVGMVANSFYYYQQIQMHMTFYRTWFWIGGGALLVRCVTQLTLPCFVREIGKEFRRVIFQRFGAKISSRKVYANFEKYRTYIKRIASFSLIQSFVFLFLDIRDNNWWYLCFDIVAFLAVFQVLRLAFKAVTKKIQLYILVALIIVGLHISYRLGRLLMNLDELLESHANYLNIIEKMKRPRVNLLLIGITVDLTSFILYFLWVKYAAINIENFHNPDYQTVLKTKGLWKVGYSNELSAFARQKPQASFYGSKGSDKSRVDSHMAENSLNTYTGAHIMWQDQNSLKT